MRGIKRMVRKGLLVSHAPLLLMLKSKVRELPKRYILACNHPDYSDGGLINLVFYWRYNTDLAIFAHEKYSRKFPMNVYVKSGECIIVSDENPAISLLEAEKEQERPICIFIEGKKTKNKAKAKTGCVRLAMRTGLPIIPLRIKKRGYVKEFIAGDPIPPSKEWDVREETDRLLKRIYEL